MRENVQNNTENEATEKLELSSNKKTCSQSEEITQVASSSPIVEKQAANVESLKSHA